MPEAGDPATSPMIPITIELPPAVLDMLERDGWRGPLTAEISRVATELLSTRGVPGRCAGALAALDGTHESLRVRVQDALCRYDNDLLNDVQSLIVRRVPPPDLNVAAVNTWLYEVAKDGATADSGHGSQAIEFVATVCREVLERQPSRLFGDAQVEVYRQQLLLHWPDAPAAAVLRPLLAEALDFGLTLADTSTIAAALRDGLDKQHDAHELAEDLIAALQPKEIEICLSPGYLRTLTEEDTGQPEGMLFARMRDELFYELGLTFPTLRFATDARLSAGCFAFKLNQRVTLPRQGLARTEMLNSAGGEPAAEAGVTLTPLGYLALQLKSELRRHAAVLLSGAAVNRAFEQLGDVCSALIVAARERISVSRLCRVLRELLAEEVSIRNLPRILEAMLACDYVLADESEQILFDERLAFRAEPPAGWNNDPVTLAAGVRCALKSYLSYKYARGQSTVSVYLLTSALQRKLARHGSSGTLVSEVDADRILGALQTHIGQLQSSTPQMVLTTREARRPFRQLIFSSYPWLPVVTYQEVSPNLSLEPIAHIGVED